MGQAYVVRSFPTPAVNLKSTGPTTILTAQSGRIFVPHYLIVRKTARSGAGAHAQVTVSNGAGGQSIFVARQPTKAADLVEFWLPDNALDGGAAVPSISTNALILNVDVASTYTTDSAEFELVGVIR